MTKDRIKARYQLIKHLDSYRVNLSETIKEKWDSILESMRDRYLDELKNIDNLEDPKFTLEEDDDGRFNIELTGYFIPRKDEDVNTYMGRMDEARCKFNQKVTEIEQMIGGDFSIISNFIITAED